MEQKLRRFAHGADKEQHDRTVSAPTGMPEKFQGSSRSFAARRQRPSGNERVEEREYAHDAEREAEITDAVDDEGLDRRGVRRGRSYQNPINRYEQSPTPSQPKNNCTKLSAETSMSMKKVKKLR